MDLRRPRRKASKRGHKPVSEGHSEAGEDPKETASQRSRQARGGAQKAGTVLKTGGVEILAIAREMVAIPAGYALRLAEWLGLGILAVLRFLRPIALAALDLARRGLKIAAREITPARALAAVTLAAAILLAVSQFLDYREVQGRCAGVRGRRAGRAAAHRLGQHRDRRLRSPLRPAACRDRGRCASSCCRCWAGGASRGCCCRSGWPAC